MTDFDNREEQLFQKCLELPPEKWESFLETSCPDDLDLQKTVLRLLQANRKAEDFLESETSKELLEADTADIAAELQRIAPAEESEGDKIGRYRLLELIGEGAWGSVWLAEQTEDIRRRVALKIIKLGLETKEFLARFETERQMLAMMDHPNIAKVLDAGATSYGRPYFVMELIRGRPLLEYANGKRLKIADRLGLFIQICEAVEHAHQKGFIHRDIKPSNILVAEKGDKPIPKIIDFGIAKTTQFHLTDKTVYTQVHTFLGTPVYTSPEQMEFSGLEVDHRADIYSLGALLYELLCGHTPFDPDELSNCSLETIRSLIREEDPPKPSLCYAKRASAEKEKAARGRGVSADKVESRLKGDLDRIVMKCLEKDRNRRYASVKALVKDLQAFLENKPVSATDPSASYRIRKYITRKRPAYAVWLEVSLVLVIALAAVIYFRTGSSFPTSLGSRPSPRSENEREKSIAVLPLDNLSPNPENAFFADGVQEDLSINLAKVSDLLVITRSSTLRYRNTGKTSREIGEELGVYYLVEGSVRRAREQILLTVKLVDSESEVQLWSERYQRTLDDLFNVQAEVTTEIVQQLQAVLLPEEKQRIEYQPTGNQLAYDYFIKAKQANFQDGKLRLFEKAVEEDPEFAEAWAYLAWFRGVYWNFERNRGDPSLLASARHALEVAVRLQPNLPIVLHAQGNMVNFEEGDQEKAIQYFLKALEIDPSFSVSQKALGLRYQNLGRLAQAQYYYELSLRTDPFWMGTSSWLLDVYIARKLWEQARRLILNNQEQHPDDGYWTFALARLDYLEKGDRSAFVAAIEACSLCRDNPWIQAGKFLIDREYEAALRSLSGLDTRDHGMRFNKYSINGPFTYFRAWELQASLLWFTLGQMENWIFEAGQLERYLREVVENDLRPNSEDWALLAVCYALLGELDQMDLAISKARKSSYQVFINRMRAEINIAVCSLVLGDHDEAIRILEGASQMEGPYHLNRYIDLWFIFDRLRGNPRFDALLED